MLDFRTWEHETITKIFKVTLNRPTAENSNYEIVWLKTLEDELVSEGCDQTSLRLSGDILDRLLIARLELDPQTMSDDLDYLPILASLPAKMTVFEYLVGCWKRTNRERGNLSKKNPVNDMQQASALLEKIRDLLISYAGLSLQEPEMFPQPQGREIGPPELISPLLSLSALSSPLSSSSSSAENVLDPTEVEPFLQDLARLGGSDSSWRAVISGFEALISIKSIAVMVTQLPEWIPSHATATTFQKVSY
ncbi:hypothetical protein ID866_11596 [Astraeus odoratus]|nr:hypothetical protein ID866_11596 [Astraeus odoratus]